MESFLSAYVATKLLDAALTKIAKEAEAFRSTLNSSTDDLDLALQNHLTMVKNWASEVIFADSASAKLTQRVFVELDCFVIPRGQRIQSSESVKHVKLEDLFDDGPQHLVFLGTPGAGKTTSMKHICNRVLTDESFSKEQINYPVLVKLRDLNGASGNFPLVTELVSIVGLKFDMHESLEGRSNEAKKAREILNRDTLCTLLNDTKALVVLDGFDEIADADLRKIVLGEIRELALKLETSSIVMTSRTGEFIHSIDNMKVFEICPLTDFQIEKFAKKWLGTSKKVKLFIDQIKKSPFGDAAIKPLNLAHLCALFERSGSIPEKPKTVYRKILRLLLDEWDEQRSVLRQSHYSKFEADRKYDFLSTLSYHLAAESDRLTFSSQILIKIYKHICRDFALPNEEAKDVAREIESHTGLLLKCGFDEYEFAHKSLQEFLAAEFIVRLPSVPVDWQIIKRLPNELGIAVTISSSSSLYFADLVLGSLWKNRAEIPITFFTSFMARLTQEKPDFDGKRTVVLALLVLYSMTIDCFSDLSDQLPLFLIDPMLKEFENLVSIVMVTNDSTALTDYYIMSRQAVVLSEHSVYTFENNKPLEGYILPDRIYVRDVFLDEIKYS